MKNRKQPNQNHMAVKSASERIKKKLSLKKHIKSVHQNLTQFSCGECKATFGLKQNMKEHIKLFMKR